MDVRRDLPRAALAGSAAVTEASTRPEAASSTADPAAARRGPPRRFKALGSNPPLELPEVGDPGGYPPRTAEAAGRGAVRSGTPAILKKVGNFSIY